MSLCVSVCGAGRRPWHYRKVVIGPGTGQAFVGRFAPPTRALEAVDLVRHDTRIAARDTLAWDSCVVACDVRAVSRGEWVSAAAELESSQQVKPYRHGSVSAEGIHRLSHALVPASITDRAVLPRAADAHARPCLGEPHQPVQ